MHIPIGYDRILNEIRDAHLLIGYSTQKSLNYRSNAHPIVMNYIFKLGDQMHTLLLVMIL